jgi:Relaxase/Mobilisation nuclease domain
VNFNKGAKTHGRGTSFKGALTYYLHDKKTLETAHRVGFTHLRNLVTDDPTDTWREMMVTAESSDRLKAAAGLKPGGRKNEQPAYVFSLEWHPDDRPSKQHMLIAAVDVLRFMKMEEHQAVIVEHTDTAHPHVHITVNMIHPDTGRSVSLSNDEYRLDRWCDAYELKYGPVRSPERRAKFAALDQGMEPPPRTPQPKHFNDPVIKAAFANDNATAQARARAIQEDFKTHAARLKATQGDAWKQRQGEQRRLWADYRTARAALRARHQFALDQIYKHRRNRDALPLSIQGFRDWRETREWKKLMARLKAEKRRFEYRERTLLGFVSNAIRLARPGMKQSGKGLLPVLFTLLVSGKARRELMLVKRGLAVRGLSDQQFSSRKTRALRVQLVRDAQMAALSRAFDIQKQDLYCQHQRDIARQKAEWSALSIERKRLWAAWEAEFGVRQRQKTDQGSGGDSHFADVSKMVFDSQAPSPARPGQNFADAAKQTPKPAGERVARKFEDSAQPGAPKPGWKQRRSAAERKADGSYKPRQRRTPKPRM